jgi:aminoglycoside phosphotransferase (APT) family kinase protein
MTETVRLAQLLASRLEALWGAAVEISGIQQLSGGASRESWGIEARTADGAERRLILLRESGGPDRGRDVALQAAAMAAARAAGVPVPELHDHGSEALGQGRAYLLMTGRRSRGGCCGTTRTRPCGPGSRAGSARSWPASTR